MESNSKASGDSGEKEVLKKIGVINFLVVFGNLY